ncbi:hypothetical protein C8054_31320 [Micromonospora sp. RP3T]|nr:hypothetical protein C8054_31320 [Micromonospora sp. RP3T]
MSRPKHRVKELEDVLREAERKNWRVDGGGNRYFKLYCPCPEKHWKTVKCTPSGANYLKDLVGQLKRATCWEKG